MRNLLSVGREGRPLSVAAAFVRVGDDLGLLCCFVVGLLHGIVALLGGMMRLLFCTICGYLSRLRHVGSCVGCMERTCTPRDDDQISVQDAFLSIPGGPCWFRCLSHCWAYSFALLYLSRLRSGCPPDLFPPLASLLLQSLMEVRMCGLWMSFLLLLVAL